MPLRDTLDKRDELRRATAPGHALAEAVEAGNVKMGSILKAVGIDAGNPVHQAALLACERYGLDPLLKHVIVIPGAGVYVTRDGRLHAAHRSGQFDGMEVLDMSETQSHWTARVAVYRKDMSRPFTFMGRYPKNGSNKQYGPEMAVKVAEVASLRRAFSLELPSLEEQWDVADQVGLSTPVPDPEPEPEPPPEPEAADE